MTRKHRKTARGIFVNAWLNPQSNYVVIVDEDFKHRSYSRVTPSSLRRAQRVQLALMEKGGKE